MGNAIQSFKLSFPPKEPVKPVLTMDQVRDIVHPNGKPDHYVENWSRKNIYTTKKYVIRNEKKYPVYFPDINDIVDVDVSDEELKQFDKEMTVIFRK